MVAEKERIKIERKRQDGKRDFKIEINYWIKNKLKKRDERKAKKDEE